MHNTLSSFTLLISLLTVINVMSYWVVIVVLAYYHIQVDASNHYAPEPSVVFPTANRLFIKFHLPQHFVASGSSIYL